jgi:hypothetical protein
MIQTFYRFAVKNQKAKPYDGQRRIRTGLNNAVDRSEVLLQ